MKISESIEIKNSLQNVYGAFADIAGWKNVLKDVLGVEVIYNDGYHQEFLMTVERPNGSETVRAIRFCEPLKAIEMFQTTPPPGFRAMRGIWTFKDKGSHVEVEAARDFELENNSTKGPEVLRGFLQRNLQSFKLFLEGNG